MLDGGAMPRWYEGSPKRDEVRGTRGEGIAQHIDI